MPTRLGEGTSATEFYTNRTAVHLMTEMLEPHPGKSIHDPTCGTGGMLLSCITHLRRQGKEWRNLFGTSLLGCAGCAFGNPSSAA